MYSDRPRGLIIRWERGGKTPFLQRRQIRCCQINCFSLMTMRHTYFNWRTNVPQVNEKIITFRPSSCNESVTSDFGEKYASSLTQFLTQSESSKSYISLSTTTYTCQSRLIPNPSCVYVGTSIPTSYRRCTRQTPSPKGSSSTWPASPPSPSSSPQPGEQ